MLDKEDVIVKFLRNERKQYLSVFFLFQQCLVYFRGLVFVDIVNICYFGVQGFIWKMLKGRNLGYVGNIYSKIR